MTDSGFHNLVILGLLISILGLLFFVYFSISGACITIHPQILQLLLVFLKQLVIKPYTVKYVPMRLGINRSSCDCGVYALKFIECHMLGLQLSLLNDDNIYAARMKITYDPWKAAHDPILIERMRKYVPPKTVCSDDIVDLL
ncbi:hypothetical protein EUTSA_v10019487mg [Eutrema salsugineum]|uniref:Ubiquitin-like protease family profile domain-containing protein n=1 Tax=Eutrema salsugineum TaxID=72664 RepID=V4JRX9_EUTSA|nr:hypothetical protein EUTSA_v10019487mg [Eutrema salsugineum]